jgi:hypothetical protein
MLIRQRGYHDGVGEYLRNGLKSGNSLHRDLRDKRVILEGDLDVLERVINSKISDDERYIHYTLAFKEDHIPTENLHRVVERFRELLLCAYDRSEYEFYAEAHLPKIKSFTNEKTGELEDRKPHIHIVIPKINLVTGRYLNPLGFYQNNIDYIEAIQERINTEFGLVSPKDSRRASLTEMSDFISRYKGDNFKSGAHDLKSRLLNEMLLAKTSSINEFKLLLEKYGKVKLRSSKTSHAYYNVKEEGKAKGVNLKEWVFSQEFIEMPFEQKVSHIMGAAKNRTAEQKLKDDESYLKLVDIWKTKRSLEIKYLHPASKEHSTYKHMAAEQQAALLKDKHTKNTTFIKKFHNSLLEPKSDHLLQQLLLNSYKEKDNVVRTRYNNRTMGTANRFGVRKLSECKLAKLPKWEGGLLLHRNESHIPRQQGDTERGNYNDVRWDICRAGGVGQPILPIEFKAESFLQDNLAELQEQRVLNQLENDTDWKKIQSELDLQILLDSLSLSHGLKPELYKVVKGKNGYDRIQCGNRRYSANDFLTKEMHFDWSAASSYIKQEYTRQKDAGQIRKRQPPNGNYWVKFKEWERLPGNSYKDVWSNQRSIEAELRRDLRASYISRRQAIYQSGMAPKDKAIQLSLLRFEKLGAEARLRNQLKEQRHQLKATLTPQQRYLSYLQKLVEEGDTKALKELRRYSLYNEKNTIKNAFATDPGVGQDSLFVNVTFSINRSGTVTYLLNNKAAITDSREWVSVIQDQNKEAIEIALRLALEKNHYKPVQLSGSEEFKRRVVEVAIEKGIKVQFQDVEMQKQHEALEREINQTSQTTKRHHRRK